MRRDIYVFRALRFLFRIAQTIRIINGFFRHFVFVQIAIDFHNAHNFGFNISKIHKLETHTHNPRRIFRCELRAFVFRARVFRDIRRVFFAIRRISLPYARVQCAMAFQ